MLNEPVEIVFKRLDERASLPAYQSELAAGMDLVACLDPSDVDAGVLLEPGGIALIPTGLAAAIPPGYEGQVRPRSGMAVKRGVTVPNAPGTIDADYRGELKVALINLSGEPQRIAHGDRVAQLVIAPVSRARVVESETLSETARGAGGFGSTGV